MEASQSRKRGIPLIFGKNSSNSKVSQETERGSPPLFHLSVEKVLLSSIKDERRQLECQESDTPASTSTETDSIATDLFNPSQNQSLVSPKTSPLPSFKTLEFGKRGTLQHRVLFRRDGWQDVSPWHDIPLYGPDGMLYFVCATPKSQWINVEVATNEKFTPLRIKRRNDKPVHYAQNLPLSYGFLPQTMFDGVELLPGKPKGRARKAPIQVFDLGTNSCRKSGDVYLVKPLVAFLVRTAAGLLSWHIIAIDREDKKASFVNGFSDLSCYFPTVINEVAAWLKCRNCLNSGNERDVIANGGEAVDLHRLLETVSDSHKRWKELIEAQRIQRDAPFSRPLFPVELELLWESQTSQESDECVEISEPCPNYDKAWAAVLAGEGSEKLECDLTKSKWDRSAVTTSTREGSHLSVPRWRRQQWMSWKEGMNGKHGNSSDGDNWKLSELLAGRRILRKSQTEAFTPLKFQVNLSKPEKIRFY